MYIEWDGRAIKEEPGLSELLAVLGQRILSEWQGSDVEGGRFGDNISDDGRYACMVVYMLNST